MSNFYRKEKGKGGGVISYQGIIRALDIFSMIPSLRNHRGVMS